MHAYLHLNNMIAISNETAYLFHVASILVTALSKGLMHQDTAIHIYTLWNNNQCKCKLEIHNKKLNYKY